VWFCCVFCTQLSGLDTPPETPPAHQPPSPPPNPPSPPQPRELERNLALRVEPGEGAESFRVSGRGTLHLGILIENMRREGYEFEIGPPKVITKEINGQECEPYEEAIVEVPEVYVGSVVELFAARKGEMVDMQPSLEVGNWGGGVRGVSGRVGARGSGAKCQLDHKQALFNHTPH
jgi:hypothetical protein